MELCQCNRDAGMSFDRWIPRVSCHVRFIAMVCRPSEAALFNASWPTTAIPKNIAVICNWLLANLAARVFRPHIRPLSMNRWAEAPHLIPKAAP